MKKKITVTSLVIFAVFVVLISTNCASTNAVKSAASIDVVSGLINKLTWLQSNGNGHVVYAENSPACGPPLIILRREF